ncbi:hypothetical protein EYB26_003513 [Talaromyces marneffei]|uniref:RING-type E3 ubiquitin transferase n=1 Tax=Talaromyces marneffei PM1 TaxID=1077442 RepID=A0A093V7F2_TALMA|nr:uncharacterized protein EYB26_003513 [Talaromyces marneffei]QGA15852.1 hypothetical protein EYB26_003513 [Talaromyces marneffei]
MGQTSSTQRDQRPEHPSRATLSSPPHSNGHSGTLNAQEMSERSVGGQTPHDEGFASNRNNIFNLITDPSTSNTSNPAFNDAMVSNNTSSFSHDLRTLPEPVQQAPPRSASTASRLLSRRQSTMSRLGTRILPNSVIRGLLSSEEETAAEGHAHRNGRIMRPVPRTEVIHNPSRFSPFNALGSRGITRRRSIRGPYPLPRGDSALIPDSPPNPTYVNPAISNVSASHRGWRRSPRLNRVRNSLSTPISHIFGAAPTLPDPEEMRIPPPRPLRSSVTEGMDQLLPPLEPMDMHMDLDGTPTSDLAQQSMTDLQTLSSLPLPRSSQGLGPGPIRRLPGILRTRSSRLPRREEQTPLSRVLQVAAAAIAAQLSGNTTPTLPNIQSLGNEGFDASLESLFQSLQQATSAQDNLMGSSGGQNASQPGAPTPLNFLRVFRFSNSDGPGGRAANGGTEQMDMEDGAEEGSEGRTVTLVVVGVRSVPSNGPLGNPQNGGGIGLDTLLGLPHLPPINGNTSQEGGNLSNPIRNTDGASRLPTSRFNNGGVSSSTDNLNSGHARPTSGIFRNPSDPTSPALPTVLADSPPGPYPPPSTPAEAPTTMSSGDSTPSRRPSSASAMSPNLLPQVHEDPLQESTQPESYPPTAGSGVRQRRRSDSEFARHRHFGSGSSRRHGVVEPDQPTPSGGRTWVIYVVGTNLSENHPAFATPSLFTDNPTYEDMILLSSLLGPAKPPVATQADITSAGGLFRLVEYAGSLVAEALEGDQTINIGETERCLICLSDYEAAEDVRQLTKCKHLYHKECIDQWLTTGRNSCPLCRGQGVTESSSSSNPIPTQESPA